MTTFSIIIPTFNYGHLLGHTLESIVNQCASLDSNIQIEIIVVDDNSSDNTQDILKNFQNNKQLSFKTISNRTNLGPAKCRNIGINYATANYVIFLDADDLMTPLSLQTIYEFIVKHHHPQVIIANHNNVIFDKQENIKNITTFTNHLLSPSNTQRFIDYLFNKIISLTAGSVIFSKDVLVRFSFCENLRLNEDLPLFAHVLVNYDCKYLNFSTVNIRKHSSSLRNNHHLLNEQANVWDLTNIIFDSTLLPKKLMKLKEKYLSQRYLSLFRSFYLAREYNQAKKFYHEAVKRNPYNLFKTNYLIKYIKCSFLC